VHNISEEPAALIIRVEVGLKCWCLAIKVHEVTYWKIQSCNSTAW